MRIGELSRKTGVPVPTIKYYVREGLLPAGELTSRNQASYGEPHERRLQLIRALADVGGMKVAEIADVLAAVDDTDRPLHRVLGSAADRMGRSDGTRDDAESAAARAAVTDLISRRGWRTHASNPAVTDLSEALAALARLGHGAFAELLDTYADAAEQVAHADLEYVDRQMAVEEKVEGVVIGTVLGEAVFSSLRRLAHVDASARLYGARE
ncbi:MULTISPECIES: MerR family transcriptional regulator [Streptomyces]|uniref:MerR family transcriptional regulator n=1 Tax=Streptomyces koelreuteriae TaxID=2838015 RepID=A0ABX8FTC0_9ACTN|nr:MULTISPECIES: MerR family transcriptional regulator [Streptomyces]QWB24286.1 MerR family transcriptional regulator [Streptomyces koelreuteriae]UUA07284.1 MerR family transcriptional regulator [Streptomyces koelreuteriae]UUA14913.1 MerR family transcriptional regulator [Streptomyces sp. CRCS-T-1]